MSEQNLVEIPENEQNENIEVLQTKKKRELSQKQIEHLNNIRVKALEKKREIKLKKNEEYKNKVSKPEVIEEPIKQPIEIKPDVKPDKAALSVAECKPDVKSDVKKKKVIKKVIRYVETDSDDDADDEVITQAGAQRCGMKKPEPIQQPKPIEKSYNELLCESSLERMQNKIMNERAKHLISHIIPNYY